MEARARTLLKTRSRHGFTLVETLVVITILTILVTIVIVAAKSIGDARRRSVAQQQLAVISQAIEQYSAFWPAWKIGGSLVADKGWPDYIGGRLFDPTTVFQTIIPLNDHVTFKGYYAPGGAGMLDPISGVYRPPPIERNPDYVGVGDVLGGNICLAYSLTAATGKGPFLPPNDLGVLKDVLDPVVLTGFQVTGDVQTVTNNPLLPGYRGAPQVGAKRAQVLVDPWGTPYRYFWVYRDPTVLPGVPAFNGWLPVPTADMTSQNFRVAQGWVLESAGPDKRFGNVWKVAPTQDEIKDAADNLMVKP